MTTVFPKMTSSANQTWFSKKSTEVQHPVKRGRKRSKMDEEKRSRAAAELHEAYRKLKSWHSVGHHYGISKAAAYRIANDKAYRPSSYVLDTVIEKSVDQLPQKRHRSRRRYYRPCLSPELGAELRDFTKDEIEGILWRAVIEAKQPGPCDQDEPE